MEQMFITPIRTLDSIADIGTAKKVGSGQNAGPAFQDIFKEAVENVKTTESDLSRQQYLLSTGQIDDAHTVPAAAAKAQLSVELLTALRNKALEAYTEIIRISI
ncbi:flagellar hook-basal body complex protein FliE [Clostridium boliviensis]|uniref:Flagellar hook-basal body complex protein FliE n=1 Tax=Clostridium boliviensis TaxID=318465 RepID=A0ABU4GKL8_9CLOT|nr:flagellar hook-basal body complex protein FliE [Clostridium boliviensis]MDW2798151.1 flagellar hook-basal body complex protein FliE [Clostridium boliviensis]